MNIRLIENPDLYVNGVKLNSLNLPKFNVETKVRVKKIENPDLSNYLDSIQYRLQGQIVTIAEIKDKFYHVKRIEFIKAINKNVEIWTAIRFSEVEKIDED